MRAKRVVNFVTLASATGKYGGPYDTSLRQCLLTSRLGYDSVLFAGVLEGDAPSVDTEATNIRVAFHEVRRVLPVKGFIGLHSAGAIRALWKEIATCDIVHVSMARELMPLSAVVLAVFGRKHLVVQTHGMMTSRSSIAHKILDVFIRPLLAKAQAVIALTTVEAEELTSWFGTDRHNIAILGNPVPIEATPRTDNTGEGGDIVFIARLHPRKRVDLFIGAAEIASEKGWAEKYSVVGPDEGNLYKVLEAQHGLDNLSYEGAISSSAVTERVRACDIFVLPSEREPWGNVLAIAIACGVPVIIPESAALAAKVRAYGAGVVVPDNDASAIADAVHSLIIDPTSYATASRGALEFARLELSAENQYSSFRALYGATTVT